MGAAMGQDRLTESIVCLKITSERRVSSGLADVKRTEVKKVLSCLSVRHVVV